MKRPGAARGVTLIELTVAIGLLVLLGTLLLLTFSDSLSLWNAGETQRQQYEESHFLLQKMTRDLRNAWIPINMTNSGSSVEAFRPYLISGFIPLDGTDRRGRWLELVRSKDGYLSGPKHARLQDRLTREIYVLLPDSGLYHTSAKAGRTFPHHKQPDRLTDPEYVKEKLSLIGPGVWYAGFRFWGPWIDLKAEEASISLTGRWPAESAWGAGNGVSLWWDSSRSAFQQFRMHNPEAELPAVPGMVRIRLEMVNRERTNWSRLEQNLSEQAGPGDPLPVRQGASRLPEAGFFRVGQEWIRADHQDGSLTIQARGARGTDPERHPAGTEVKTGTGFSVTVNIPVYPGRQYYYDREVTSGANTQ